MYRGYYLLLLITCVYSAIDAQNITCLYCYENPLEVFEPENCAADEIVDDQLVEELNLRLLQYDFHHTLRKIHQASTFSSFTNWKKKNMGYQKKPYILDADVNVPIAIQGPRRLGFNTFHFVPRFKFRIFRNDEDFPFGNGDTSYPVRTPSAIPGAAYYISSKRFWKENPEGSNFSNMYIGVYGYHHSNGQDGPELDSLQVGEVNVYNGSFGENVIFDFIIGGYKEFTSFQHDFMNPKNQTIFNDPSYGNERTLKLSTRKELFWRMTYEWHPESLANEIFDDLDILARRRVKLDLTYIVSQTLWDLFADGSLWCQLSPEQSYEKWRHELNIAYVLDRSYKRGNYLNPDDVGFGNLKRRLNINYTFHYVIGRSQFAGIFAQIGYLGSDEYNIYFNDSYVHFRMGLSTAFFDQPQRTQYSSF